MKMVSGMTRLGLLGVAALFMTGCDKGELAQKDEEIKKLNSIIVTYDKENRALMEAIERDKLSHAQSDEELRGRQRQIDLLRSALEKAGRAGPSSSISDIQFRRLQEIAQQLGGNMVGNRIQLPGDVLFDTGSWAIKSGAQSTLKQLSQELQKGNFGLMVLGYTDNQPIKRLLGKGIGSNRHLSLMRSLAVTNYMQGTCGYPADKLLPAGWGELNPAADNTSKAGMAKNRRVEIFVDPDISNLTVQAAAVGVSGVTGSIAEITGEIPAVTATEDGGAYGVIIEK